MTNDDKGTPRWAGALLTLCALSAACADTPLPTEALEVQGIAKRAITGPVVMQDGGDPRRPAGVSPEFAARFFQRPDTIRNRYIVLFRESAPAAGAAAEALVRAFGGHPKYVYESALRGMAVYNLDSVAVDRLRRHPHVAQVVESAIGQATSVQAYPVSQLPGGGGWGLDRIDQRVYPGGTNVGQGVFASAFRGAGVSIYIVDSGIRGDHSEFRDPLGNSRIGQGAAFINFSNNASAEIDQSGHGTAVASAAAGLTVGVAREATIHSVRVNDNGSTWVDDAAAGLDWIGRQRDANPSRPMVANLSISFGSGGDIVRDALNKLAGKRVVVVKGANNANEDACLRADMRTQYGQVLRVGSSTISDTRNEPTAFGSCLDVFAPGASIAVADASNSTGLKQEGGNSIASPMVAGVAAGILEQVPSAWPGFVYNVIISSATAFNPANVGPASPRRLLYSWHPHLLWNTPTPGTTINSSDATQNVTWTADPIGGGGASSWSYVWEVSLNGGPWQFVGSGKSYTRTIGPREQGQVGVRVTATTRTHITESFTLSETYTIQPPTTTPCGPGVPC